MVCLGNKYTNYINGIYVASNLPCMCAVIYTGVKKYEFYTERNEIRQRYKTRRYKHGKGYLPAKALSL